MSTDLGNYRLNKDAKSLIIQVVRPLHNDLLDRHKQKDWLKNIYCILVYHFRADTGVCRYVGAGPCGCPLKKYYRLNFFSRSHAGVWERGAKLVRHLFKRQVAKKLRLKCHSFRGLYVKNLIKSIKKIQKPKKF